MGCAELILAMPKIFKTRSSSVNRGSDSQMLLSASCRPQPLIPTCSFFDQAATNAFMLVLSLSLS
eukprot:c34327_g1_i1 orf=3-194(-)